jgi:hypothetical protein
LRLRKREMSEDMKVIAVTRGKKTAQRKIREKLSGVRWMVSSEGEAIAGDELIDETEDTEVYTAIL